MPHFIEKLHSAGINKDTPNKLIHKVRLINGLCLLAGAILFLFAFIDAGRQSWIEVMVDLVSIPPLLLPLWLNKLGKTNQSRIAFLLIIGGIYLFTILSLGAIYPILSILPIIFAATCAIFDAKSEKKILIGSMLFSSLAFALGLMLPKQGILINLTQDHAIDYFVLFFNTMSICWMLIFYNSNLNDYIDLLAKQFKTREQEIATIHQVGKFAAIGQLAGGIAHEINNPLAIIRGKLQILSQEINQKKASPEYIQTQLESIIKTTTRISRITHSMLTLARTDRGSTSTFKASEILSDTVTLVQESFAKYGIALLVDSGGGTGNLTIESAVGPLQQVLMNLLSNARDALLDQKEKKITNTGDLWIKISTYLKDQYLVVQVEDNGPGIPDHLRDRIMEAFFTTKEVGKGTGLGLSLSKSIMEALGGKLELSRQQNPTTFLMMIPVTNPGTGRISSIRTELRAS
jgi:signal transduction histidine kinase